MSFCGSFGAIALTTFVRAAAFRDLVEYLEGGEQAAALDEAVLAARQEGPRRAFPRVGGGRRSRSHVLALEFLKESLASVRQMKADIDVQSDRFLSLQLLAPLVVTDPTLRDNWIDQVLELERGGYRTTLLSDLVRHGCGPDTHYRLWRRIYRRLASRGRDDLLTEAIPLPRSSNASSEPRQ
jgi:hypothetical protein